MGMQFSKKSPTGPTERTLKPENLIAPSNFLRGPLVRSHSIPDGNFHFPWKSHLLHQPSKYLPGFILTSLAPFGPLPLRRFTHQRIRGAERIRTRAAVRMQGDQQRHVLTSNKITEDDISFFFQQKKMYRFLFFLKKDRNNFGVSFLKISVSFCSFPFWLDHSIWKKSSSPSST